jgi:hypothetical protein
VQSTLSFSPATPTPLPPPAPAAVNATLSKEIPSGKERDYFSVFFSLFYIYAANEIFSW